MFHELVSSLWLYVCWMALIDIEYTYLSSVFSLPLLSTLVCLCLDLVDYIFPLIYVLCLFFYFALVIAMVGVSRWSALIHCFLYYISAR